MGKFGKCPFYIKKRLRLGKDRCQQWRFGRVALSLREIHQNYHKLHQQMIYCFVKWDFVLLWSSFVFLSDIFFDNLAHASYCVFGGWGWNWLNFLVNKLSKLKQQCVRFRFICFFLSFTLDLYILGPLECLDM